MRLAQKAPVPIPNRASDGTTKMSMVVAKVRSESVASIILMREVFGSRIACGSLVEMQRDRIDLIHCEIWNYLQPAFKSWAQVPC